MIGWSRDFITANWNALTYGSASISYTAIDLNIFSMLSFVFALTCMWNLAPTRFANPSASCFLISYLSKSSTLFPTSAMTISSIFTCCEVKLYQSSASLRLSRSVKSYTNRMP